MNTSNTDTKSLLMIHIAVLFFGMAGVIGRGLTIPSFAVTFGRVFFSSITLFIVIKCTNTPIKLQSRGDFWAYIAAGIIMALHWTTFMRSVQVASVAVGTITFSTFPLFVTFIEPVLFKEKLKVKSVICALLMLLGVSILVPPDGGGATVSGIVAGMVSALTYAILSLLNRRFSSRYAGSVVCFYEQSIATLALIPFVLAAPPAVTGKDILSLVVLGVFCTALAHSLFVSSFKKVRVQTAGIISGGMESVYGILLAFLLLGEPPTAREIIGGCVVIAVTVYTTLTNSKE
ncbi:MAG: DMT family transporter [Clostridia bacterium]|nr:DMT family transporter [Clostridia bacterium]